MSYRIYQHELLQAIPAVKGEVQNCFFSGDLELFARNSNKGHIFKLREEVEGRQKYLEQQLRYISPRGQDDVQMTTVDFHCEMEKLATGTPNGAVIIWSSNEELQRFYPFRSPVSILKWNPSGTKLACADENGNLLVRNCGTKDVIRLKATTETPTQIVWIGNEVFAVATIAGDINIYQTKEPKQPRTFKAHSMKITDLVWSQKTECLVSTAEDNTTKVWSLGKSDPVFVLNETSKVTRLVMAPPRGLIFASIYEDGVVNLRDVRFPHKKWVLLEVTEPVTALNFSPFGEMIIGGFNNGDIKGWDTMTGRVMSNFNGKYGGITDICWNQSWNRVVAGTSKGKVLYLHGGYPRCQYI